MRNRLTYTYVTVQKQFAGKLQAGEDQEGELLLELGNQRPVGPAFRCGRG